jgi:hypothetical protein
VKISLLATVAFAVRRSLASFRTADLAAVGALAGLSFDATVFVDMRASDTAGAAMREDLAHGEQRSRNNREDDFHIGIILDLNAKLSRSRGPAGSAPLAPGSHQRLRLGLARLHDEIPAFAGLADIVGLEGEADAFGAASAAFETQMTPPSAIVVPNVVICAVFAVGEFYDLVHTAYCLGIFEIPKENSS